jgi:NAD(P) transhydrogenase subunit beta
MCRAMNRSIKNVLIGGFGDGAGATKREAKKVEGTVTKMEAEEVAALLLNAKSVIIVPGYGMAVAKAQHSIATITKMLLARGTNVRFAIHPVAGRLPGHMNGTCIMTRVCSRDASSIRTAWKRDSLI